MAMHTTEYNAVIKRKELSSSAAAGRDLENIMRSEISQSEKDTYHRISLICGI